jgi:hypothetical protein
MFLIWRLSRSVVERCLISFLMAMGLFATGAGVMKIIYAYTYDRTLDDALREMMPEFLWCRVEEVVLIVASSAPLLKSPVGHALKKMGFPSFQEKTRDLSSFHSSYFEPPCEPLVIDVKTTVVEVIHTQRVKHDEEKGEAVGECFTASASTLSGTDGLWLDKKPTDYPSCSTVGNS